MEGVTQLKFVPLPFSTLNHDLSCVNNISNDIVKEFF